MPKKKSKDIKQPRMELLSMMFSPVPELDRGASGRFLSVDLGTGNISVGRFGEEEKTFLRGGKGYCLGLLAKGTLPTTKWNDPENKIVFAGGRLAGSPVCGSGKAIATTFSPLCEQKEGRGDKPMDSNFGSGWGTVLKHAGYDALEITGKTDKDVVLVIDGSRITVELYGTENLPDDPYELSAYLSEKYAPLNKNGKKDYSLVSVASTGIGAKNTLFGCVNASYHRGGKFKLKQAGRGIGSVFADKGLKAVVVVARSTAFELNNYADPEMMKAVARFMKKMNVFFDKDQNYMRKWGTAHIPPHVNGANCLPVNNFQRGSDPRADKIGPEAFAELFDKGASNCCRDCSVMCAHGISNLKMTSGPDKGKCVHVDGPEYETIAAWGSNLGIFDAKFIAEANYYCDKYGIDTISAGIVAAFMMECFEKGVIGKKETGGLRLEFGNKRAALELLHRMGQGRGVGRRAGLGVERLKKAYQDMYPGRDEFSGFIRWVIGQIAMASKGLEFSLYVTRESLAQQLGYGLALKGAHHDEAWLIFLDRVKGLLPTDRHKAEALRWYPHLRTWFSLYGLCKLPWNDIVPSWDAKSDEPAKVMSHVKQYMKMTEAALGGKKLEPEDLYLESERVYNFQRLLAGRQGHGGVEDDVIPYRAMGPVLPEEYAHHAGYYDEKLLKAYGVSSKDWSTDEKWSLLYHLLNREYKEGRSVAYQNRGWDENGIPDEEHIIRMYAGGSEFVVPLLKTRSRVKAK